MSVYILIEEIPLNLQFLYYSAIFAFSILASFEPFFYSFMLVDIFRRFPILRNILLSLYHPRV